MTFSTVEGQSFQRFNNVTNDDIERISAGVDYVTMTLTDDSPCYGEWRALCNQELENIAKEGNKVEERALMGYYGFSVANCFVGTLDGRTMASFQGHYADHMFYHCYREDANYSRIDLQFTMTLKVMDSDLGRKHDDEAVNHVKSLPAGTKRNIRRMSGIDGGYTLYIGAASSKQMGRIYNKEVQSEDIEFTRSWRYEVVLRDGLCDAYRRDVFSAGMHDRGTILAAIHAWYTIRGVNLSFIVPEREYVAKPVKSVPSDDDRKLKWLRDQVVPTVNYLAKRGYEYDLRELFYMITNDSHYPSCALTSRDELLDDVWYDTPEALFLRQ